MLSRSWLVAVVVMGSVVWAGSEAALAGCSTCGNPGMAAYGAMACGAPEYGSMMVPGCCECPPNCCDHVWDGYCQEKGCHKRLCGKACRVPARVVCQPVGCQPEMVLPAPVAVGPPAIPGPRPVAAPPAAVGVPTKAPPAAPSKTPAEPPAKNEKR